MRAPDSKPVRDPVARALAEELEKQGLPLRSAALLVREGRRGEAALAAILHDLRWSGQSTAWIEAMRHLLEQWAEHQDLRVQAALRAWERAGCAHCAVWVARGWAVACPDCEADLAPPDRSSEGPP